jgi:hypothetical protein
MVLADVFTSGVCSGLEVGCGRQSNRIEKCGEGTHTSTKLTAGPAPATQQHFELPQKKQTNVDHAISQIHAKSARRKRVFCSCNAYCRSCIAPPRCLSKLSPGCVFCFVRSEVLLFHTHFLPHLASHFPCCRSSSPFMVPPCVRSIEQALPVKGAKACKADVCHSATGAAAHHGGPRGLPDAG